MEGVERVETVRPAERPVQWAIGIKAALAVAAAPVHALQVARRLQRLLRVDALGRPGDRVEKNQILLVQNLFDDRPGGLP